jgi:hypothetical protein
MKSEAKNHNRQNFPVFVSNSIGGRTIKQELPEEEETN